MKKLALLYVVLLIALVSCQQMPHVLDSEAIGWKATNPGGGGAFNSPVITPEGYWAVGSDLGGVYISRNQGSSWYAVGSRFGLNVTHIASMAAAPSGNLLIGTDSGLFVSRSDGRNARRVFGSGYIAAITVSADPNIIYAVVHPQWDALNPYLIRSNDGGETWHTTGSNLPATLHVVGMRAHPVDASGVWVISGQGRFNVGPRQAYFSTNAGQSFIRLDPQQGGVIDVAYAQDPNNLNLMYATTVLSNGTGQIFKSLDSGFSWRNITPAGQKPSGVILADATNASRIRIIDLDQRAGKETFLWESTNAGASWTRHSLSVSGGWSGSDEKWGLGSSFQGYLQTIGYNPGTPNTVLWVNSQFVYKSSNGGKTWADAVSRVVSTSWRSRGIDNVVPVIVEPSAADPNLVYTGYMDMGLWRTDDGGASWKSLNVPQYSGGWSDAVGGNTLSVIADPARADVVWAQVGGNLENCNSPCQEPMYLLKSTNRGASWTRLSTGLPNSVRRLEGLNLAPDSPETSRWLYVAVNGDVYLSRNDGNSWQRVLDCPNNDCIRIYYTASSGVFALSPSGIWRSWQGGVVGSWQQLGLPITMTTGWTPGLHWLHNVWDYVGPLDMASQGNKLWVAVKGSGKGIYYSADNGQTWTRVRADNYARTVEVDPLTQEVYMGSSSAFSQGGFKADSNGVFVSPNGLNNWTARNQGLAYKFATSIAISATGQRWLISPGQGVMTWQ